MKIHVLFKFFFFLIFKQCVEESYDIPRSHQIPYHNLKMDDSPPPQSMGNNDITPTTECPSLDTLRKTNNRSHFYSNAAPSKVNGNVFRYDFVEQVT